MQRNSSVKFCVLPWTTGDIAGPLRLNQTLPVLESDSIKRIGARSYSGIVQKRKSHRDSIRHHERTAKTNRKPNTKSHRLNPRNRLIDPPFPVRRLAGSSGWSAG